MAKPGSLKLYSELSCIGRSSQQREHAHARIQRRGFVAGAGLLQQGQRLLGVGGSRLAVAAAQRLFGARGQRGNVQVGVDPGGVQIAQQGIEFDCCRGGLYVGIVGAALTQGAARLLEIGLGGFQRSLRCFHLGAGRFPTLL